ncbi:hypothetical protein [Microbacterium gorillae]|uniref:hypothetical protein n=1 Tax=Microbacterium gorillae TaxID=1231063 RepID=UPI001143BAFB|nr:hypothetical protein [Microbacterium gorillae]
MSENTQTMVSEPGIRATEITMSVLVGAIVGTVTVTAMPAEPFGLVTGIAAGVAVALGLDLVVRRVRRAYLAHD